jgi:predicted MFS family arabinose efflux permease
VKVRRKAATSERGDMPGIETSTAPAMNLKPSRPGYRWAVLAVATIAQATASFGTQGLGVLAGFLQQYFHLTSAEVGLLITVSGAAPIVALPIVGDMLDRRSERVVISAGAAIVALGLAAAGLGANFPLLLMFLFVAGIGYSTAQPGGSKSVSSWFRDDRLGLAMGVRQAGLPMGGALAAAVLPDVTGEFGWRAAFVLCAAVALAGGIAFGLIYRTPSGRSERSAQKPMTAASLVFMARQPAMRRIVASGAALVAAQYAVLSFLMLFLRDEHGIPLTEAAWFIFTVQIFGMLGRVVLAAWSDRPAASRFGMVLASMSATAAGLILLPLLPPGTPFGALLMVSAWLGFFGLGWYGPWVAHLTEVSPPENVGLALGAAMASNQIFIIAAPPLLGLLHDLTGSYLASWYVAAGLLIAAAWRMSRV